MKYNYIISIFQLVHCFTNEGKLKFGGTMYVKYLEMNFLNKLFSLYVYINLATDENIKIIGL